MYFRLQYGLIMYYFSRRMQIKIAMIQDVSFFDNKLCFCAKMNGNRGTIFKPDRRDFWIQLDRHQNL